MASFSIELTAKTIPLFAGNYEELEGFIITAELVEKTLSEAAKQDFLQYLYHAKLTSGVRTAIGSYVKPENFAALKTLLQERYKCTKTIPELQSKLSMTYQGKLSVNQYKERITNIIDNLNKLGIEELGNETTEAEKNVIIRLNNKLALDVFKKGINDNLKTALFAARPKSIQEAVELALELESEQKTNNGNIMYIQKRQQHNKYNNNNRYQNSYHNRNNSNNNNFSRNNNAYNQNNFKNYNNYNNNNPKRPNIHTRYTDHQSNSRPNNYNRRNQYNQNTNTNNYNRRNIHTIQSEGNVIGSEYISIPDSQN